MAISLQVSSFYIGQASSSESTRLLQQSRKVISLGLKIGVSSNVLFSDEDAGHGSLARHLRKGTLNGRSIICRALSILLSQGIMRTTMMQGMRLKGQAHLLTYQPRPVRPCRTLLPSCSVSLLLPGNRDTMFC